MVQGSPQCLPAMYQRILFTYDGSEAGQQMLWQCHELAHWSHAQLWLVAVKPPRVAFPDREGGFYTQELDILQSRRVERVLQEGLCRLSAHGFQAQSALLHGESVHAISNFAQQIQADLIVVGHRHLARWAARWWAGALSGALIEHAPCSVLFAIAPAVAHQMGQTVDL